MLEVCRCDKEPWPRTTEYEGKAYNTCGRCGGALDREAHENLPARREVKSQLFSHELRVGSLYFPGR